jgi:hypothetical protein
MLMVSEQQDTSLVRESELVQAEAGVEESFEKPPSYLGHLIKHNDRYNDKAAVVGSTTKKPAENPYHKYYTIIDTDLKPKNKEKKKHNKDTSSANSGSYLFPEKFEKETDMERSEHLFFKLNEAKQDMADMADGKTKTAFAAEIKRAKADCDRFKEDVGVDCKQVFCKYENFCTSHGTSMKVDSSCESLLAKDHKSAIGSVFDVPEKDINSKCGSESEKDKVSCVCKKAKNWAYDSCKTVVKHVDRQCMSRYSKLHLFVVKEKAAKKLQSDKKLKQKEDKFRAHLKAQEKKRKEAKIEAENKVIKKEHISKDAKKKAAEQVGNDV